MVPSFKRLVKRSLQRAFAAGFAPESIADLVAARVGRELPEKVAALMLSSLEREQYKIANLYERKKVDEVTAIDKGMQLLLALKYRELLHQGAPLPPFADVEFRCFSQNGEDGILLYLFSVLGTVNRKAVEICAGNGIECNTTNLIVNHGWAGLLMDGSEANVATGRGFFAECRDTLYGPPTFLHAWVTRDNVNALIAENGFDGEIDLLSLDLDGMDYWTWQALECARPRVVVVEYNAAWGPNDAVTVPWQADFRLDFSRRPYYCGASLPAFVKLGRQKGYRLVGCQRLGFNAFFVRGGVGEDQFPEVPAAQCLKAPQEGYDWGDRVWERV
jgi:hypothetical protein